MIGANGIGAEDPERVREMERDKEEERELLPPSVLRSLRVLVNVRVGNENTFVLALRIVAPWLGGTGNDLFLPSLTIPCLFDVLFVVVSLVVLVLVLVARLLLRWLLLVAGCTE